MCEFVTSDAFSEFASIGGLEMKYNSEDLEKLNNDTFEGFREDVYLDDIFGVKARLDYEVWI